MNDIESIWIEFSYPHTKSFLVSCVYRPPSALQSWIDRYEIQIDLVDSKKNEFYILGDFNIDYNADKSKNKYNNMKWSGLLSKFGLKQYIETPTRVTKNSSTIIDHLYASKLYAGNISNVFVPSFSISDHYPICFTRCTNKKDCFINI